MFAVVSLTPLAPDQLTAPAETYVLEMPAGSLTSPAYRLDVVSTHTTVEAAHSHARREAPTGPVPVIDTSWESEALG